MVGGGRGFGGRGEGFWGKGWGGGGAGQTRLCHVITIITKHVNFAFIVTI